MALPIKRKSEDRKKTSGITLSNEQMLFVKHALEGKNILVNACIGSGKTSSIQYLCDQIPEEKSILYLTYNKLLKIDAKKKIKNKNVMVQNYHGFAYWILLKSGVTPGYADSVTKFINAEPIIPHYDVLIIDEYQDIETELSLLLEYIKKNNPGIQIIAVGDMDQKIYDKTSLDVDAFIHSFLGDDIVEMSFTKCFRLSDDIAEMLSRVWEKPIVGVNENCQVDQMTVSEVKEFLKDKKPKDVLCLGSRTGDMSKLLNDLEAEYPDQYNKKTVFASIRNKDGGGATEPNTRTAIFTTFDSSKGLERPICVIFDWTYDYWLTRMRKPNQSYTILKNIFCVAASRGKEQIIFVSRDDSLLTEDELMTDQTTGKYFDEMMSIDDMFDFKYKEDIEDAYNCLNITKKSITKSGKSDINIEENDEMIDLTPCIIKFLKTFYFDKYDFSKDIDQYFKIHKDFKCDSRVKDAPLEEQILYLVSMETRQNRYRTQVELPFIKQFEKNQLEFRIGELLAKSEEVQIPCEITFNNQPGDKLFSVVGLADVVKDNVVYDLSFMSQFSHQNYLVTACHMIALGKEQGYLWNLYNNEIYSVEIPDRQRFMDAVAVAITKGKLKKYYGDL